MGFGREMEEFVAAFKTGASIKSEKRQLDNQEQDSIRKDKLARAEAERKQKQYDQTYSQNERRLEGAQSRHLDGLKIRQAEIEAANKRNTANLGERAAGRVDTMNRHNDLKDRETTKAEAAKKKAILENPMLDEEANAATEAEAQARFPDAQRRPKKAYRDGEQALPLDVNPADRAGVSGAAPDVRPALDAGLKYLQERVINGSAIDGEEKFGEGEGAREPEEVELMEKLVDPDGKLDERMRSLVVMSESYERLMKAGKTEEAAAMAASLIQSSRIVASLHGGAAKVKMDEDDTDGAIEEIERGMNSIPDGREVRLDPETMTFQYVSGQSRDVIAEGEITPESILAMANGLEDGTVFWKTIMQAAQGDDAAAKSVGLGKDQIAAQTKAREPRNSDDYFKANAPEPKDYETTSGDFGVDEETGQSPLTEVAKQLFQVRGPDGKAMPHPLLAGSSGEEIANYMGEEGYTGLEDLTTYVAAHNNVDSAQAAEIAFELAKPLSDPEAWNFKMPRRGKATGLVELKLPSGTSVFMPERASLVALRAARNGLSIMNDELSKMPAAGSAPVPQGTPEMSGAM